MQRGRKHTKEGNQQAGEVCEDKRKLGPWGYYFICTNHHAVVHGQERQSALGRGLQNGASGPSSLPAPFSWPCSVDQVLGGAIVQYQCPLTTVQVEGASSVDTVMGFAVGGEGKVAMDVHALRGLR